MRTLDENFVRRVDSKVIEGLFVKRLRSFELLRKVSSRNRESGERVSLGYLTSTEGPQDITSDVPDSSGSHAPCSASQTWLSSTHCPKCFLLLDSSLEDLRPTAHDLTTHHEIVQWKRFLADHRFSAVFDFLEAPQD